MTIAEYEQLYKACRDTAIGYAIAMGCGREDAEDVTQDCFVSLLDNIGNVDNKGAKSYIYTAIHNKVIDLYRKNAIQNEIPIDDLPDDDDCDIDMEHEYDELYKSISNIPAKQSAAIYLYFWNSLSYKQIADELAITERAVHTLLYRAKCNLRKALVNAKS